MYDVPLMVVCYVRAVQLSSCELYQLIGTSGVMVARGLLNNPALFAGHDVTPVQCVRDWVSQRGFVGAYL